jgi:hypothetical protein
VRDVRADTQLRDLLRRIDDRSRGPELGPYAQRSGAGVHPVLRARPSGVLRHYAPEHRLVGYGRGPLATTALGDALDRVQGLRKLALKLPSMAAATTGR